MVWEEGGGEKGRGKSVVEEVLSVRYIHWSLSCPVVNISVPEIG